MFNPNDISELVNKKLNRVNSVKIKSMVSSIKKNANNSVIFEIVYKINPIRNAYSSDYMPSISGSLVNGVGIYGRNNTISEKTKLPLSVTYLDHDQKAVRGTRTHAFYMRLSMSFYNDFTDDKVIKMRQTIRKFKMASLNF